ncbi:hypothetical protein TSTA_022600 [Talaromyces stipitatus ATCC 10500]|uniref:Uncharacterized protein n=1 Tax=Talaromyces stipitatus (strain ATCC 10500 / CBS 375.48 / QM 6759 / NRRL 1006) TaxID=441959 RepID=B8MI44_TALSN|nr:uncharacterized protein TSTA_022600 [Talaromyces stipitatus ATCC 10500]EED17206.1 hypothetical protein TSTA_022600 [Talaromyces stipitatus ATCC 10500]
MERIETSNVIIARSTSPVKDEFFSCETAHGLLVRAVDVQKVETKEPLHVTIVARSTGNAFMTSRWVSVGVYSPKKRLRS